MIVILPFLWADTLLKCVLKKELVENAARSVLLEENVTILAIDFNTCKSLPDIEGNIFPSQK